MDIEKSDQRPLDSIKQVSPNGKEYWTARELQLPLGYEEWEKFKVVIEKAKMACETTGRDSENHFYPKAKMVSIGSGAERKLSDYYVSRYGAYLIAMNGNTRLPEIAGAQIYFAVQTRKQELSSQAPDIDKRIELRDRVKDANKHLGNVAKDSGVQNYGLFHAAGYRGLYGMKLKQIKEQKGIGPKEQLLDRAGRAELAANEFRITQTEEALKNDQVNGDIPARETHARVGKEVRKTIEKIGGTMPEDLPAEPSIKKLTTGKHVKRKPIEKKTDNK